MAEGGSVCTPCPEKRQAKARRQRAEQRATGLCTKCGNPAFGGLTYCGPCAAIRDAQRPPELKNAQARRRYANRAVTLVDAKRARTRRKCLDSSEPRWAATLAANCAFPQPPSLPLSVGPARRPEHGTLVSRYGICGPMGNG